MGNVTLEAEAAFGKWRAERHSQSEPIPNYLWEMAVGLYPRYKRSNICHRLRLSGSQFKQRLESDDPTFVDSGFILASSDDVKGQPKPSPDVQLTVQGKERVLTLCVSVHMLDQILPRLGALL